jgi:hypothetical protein
MWSSSAFLCCSVAALTQAGLEGTARADSAACKELVVWADDPIARRWPELPGEVRRAFGERRGVDRCASVRLTQREEGIGVAVSLLDGRSAERSVRHAEDVIPVLEALLVLPDESQSADLPAPLPTARAESASARRTTLPSPENPRRASPERADRAALLIAEDAAPGSPGGPGAGFGVEVAVSTAARAGDGQYSVGLVVATLLDIEHWLAGFMGRADSFTVGEGSPHAALEFGASFGRRFSAGPCTLDLVAGPAVAFQGESTVETGPAGERTETIAGVVPRIHVASHLNFARGSVLRPFFGLEGELGTGSASEPEFSAGLQPLPEWMVGLSLGAALGTR